MGRYHKQRNIYVPVLHGLQVTSSNMFLRTTTLTKLFVLKNTRGYLSEQDTFKESQLLEMPNVCHRLFIGPILVAPSSP